MELSTQELDVAREIVNISIAKAADMLSFFIKQKVLTQSSTLSFISFTKDTKFSTILADPITVLKTEIKGEFTGNCYLLLSQQQKENILQITLPKNVLADEKLKEEQGTAILLEIDNIITASVVSQFSNLLNLKMYGYVPQLLVVPHEQINNYLYEENATQDVLMNIKTKLLTGSNNIHPEFVWFLNKDVFVREIKKLIKNK